jgi:hypothetical protein
VGWRIYDEAIEMVERRHRYFPRVFRWRGRRYDVHTVEKSWSRLRRGWRPIERHYFLVLCDEGKFEIYQDAQSNTWHLRRARPCPSRAVATRQAAMAWR